MCKARRSRIYITFIPDKLKNKIDLILPSFLVFLLIIPVINLFTPGLPVTHDGREHLLRIASFYSSLVEGNIIPRWAGNLNWGYGHPVFIFFYPLPYYLASAFHFLGFSFIDSHKLVFVSSFILSGFFMYLWIKEVFGRQAAFVSALVYSFAPYRFVDIFVRGAIGECLAFVWLPLICYFISKFVRLKTLKYAAGLSLSIALLILSHNALSLMFLIFIGLYQLYQVLSVSKKLPLLVSFVLLNANALLLSAFFWLPALFEAKYTLQDIVTNKSITGFEPLGRLIWSSWNFGGSGVFSVQVGPVQWICMLLAPFAIWFFRKHKDSIWLFAAFVYLIFIFSVIMILPIAKPFYLATPFVQKFQFAWRFLSLAIICPAVFAGAIIFLVSKVKKRYSSWLVGLIVALSLILNRSYWAVNGYVEKIIPEPLGVQETTTNDTGESSPIWSIRRMENFPKAPLEIIEGRAEVTPIFRNSTRHLYRIKAQTDLKVLENTLYFPGWTLSANGEQIEPEFQNPDFRGLITFSLDRGEYDVELNFRETRLRKMANMLSVFGLFFTILLVLVKGRKIKYL